MKTSIDEGKVQPNKPVIIEGLPGLGSIGIIVTNCLIKQSKATRIAVLHSPHFPYYALVNERGVARLPRNEFYYYKSRDGKKEIVMITGDCQPQNATGQYEVAEQIVDYAARHSAKLIVTVGGYSSSETEKPKVVGAATSDKLSKELAKLGIIINKMGIPVVGVAGLILPLAETKGLDAICLLAETVGYVPDPKAAKSVLTVLSRLLKLELNYTELDAEIKRTSRIEEKISQAAQRLEEETVEKKLDERFSYIS